MKKCERCFKMTDDIWKYQERKYVSYGKSGYFRDGKLYLLCKKCYDWCIKLDKKHYQKVMRMFFWIVVMFVIVLASLITWELTR